MRSKFILTALILLLPSVIFSQCKNVAKRDCLPKLTPYSHNGQVNSTVLMAGETAELEITVNSRLDYRILVCVSPILGKGYFKLIDMDKKVVYDSQKSDTPELWDFNVESTQQFTLEVSVPKSTSPNNIIPSGCATVLVGFK